MTAELIFKDRHAYGGAAVPAFVAAVVAFFVADDMGLFNRVLLSAVAGGIIGTLALLLFSVVAAPVAWYRLYRAKGFSRSTTVLIILAALTGATVAWVVVYAVFAGIEETIHWLFDGSRFMLILSGLWILYTLVATPYFVYKDRKARNQLNVINVTPSGRTDLIKN